MKGINTEIKVGLFVLLSFAALFYMTFKMEGLPFYKKKGEHNFIIYFNTIAGVSEKSPVKMAGVKIGEIGEIALEDYRAKVVVYLDNGVPIPVDSVAKISSTGLLGEKYIIIEPGKEHRLLANGQRLKNSEDPADIDEVISKVSDALDDVKKVTESLRDSFGSEDGKEGLKSIINNVADLSESMNSIISGNEERLNAIIDNVNKATNLLQAILSENRDNLRETFGNFNSVSKSLAERAPDLLAHLDEAATGVREVVNENKADVRNVMANLSKSSEKLDEIMVNLKSITGKVEKGGGTIGKLIQEEEVYNNLNDTLVGAKGFVNKAEDIKIALGARVEQQTRKSESKSFFSVKVQPKEDKFYLFEVGEDVRQTTVDKRNALNSLLYTFQIGKRYGDLTLRGGLMESSGGVGLDYYLWRDKLQFSMDTFNFGGYDTIGSNPQLKLTGRYFPQKYVYLYIGGDELLNDAYSTFFAGAGIMANEDDIKYLFGFF